MGGEYIRQDITESEQGVPLTLDIAIYDVDTCEPVTDAWVEIWRKFLLYSASLNLQV